MHGNGDMRYNYQGDIRIYELVKVEMTPVLNKVIKVAARGCSFTATWQR